MATPNAMVQAHATGALKTSECLRFFLLADIWRVTSHLYYYYYNSVMHEFNVYRSTNACCLPLVTAQHLDNSNLTIQSAYVHPYS